MKTGSNANGSGLVPTDEVEATRRLETVEGFGSEDLAALTKEYLLIPWWSFFWLHPELHPDDAEAWPEEVAEALPLATEAFRRYGVGEITDGEYYPVEAVRDRILQARVSSFREPSQPQQSTADISEL